MNSKIDISIIIPVYNCIEYLSCCLDSIVNQSKKEIEIIVVDDGSSDGSGELSEQFAKQDSRICVFHTENRGLVAARKEGLRHCKGRYVLYVDADDWIDEDMCHDLYCLAESHDCDIVASGYYRQFDNYYVEVRNLIDEGLYNRDSIERLIIPQMLYNGTYYNTAIRPSMTIKLFKKKILLEGQMSVPTDITIGEDVAVTYNAISASNKIYVTGKIYYHYRQHNNSMCKVVDDPGILSRLKSLHEYLTQTIGRIPAVRTQINAFTSYMLVQRCLSVYDLADKVFVAFGGVERNTELIVYGAGNFGKQIYNYAVSHDFKVVWVDKQHEFYQKQGLPVAPIESIRNFANAVILIGIIDEDVATKVRCDLHNMRIRDDRIRWLDVEFLVNNIPF